MTGEETTDAGAVAEQPSDETTTTAQEKSDNAQADETTASLDKADETPAKDTASSSGGRPKRERKSATNYAPEQESKKEITIPDGKGEKLKDMPNVVAKFQDVTWSTPSLKSLYNIVFGRGKKADFKKHLLQFNGFCFTEENEEDEKDKVTQKVNIVLFKDDAWQQTMYLLIYPF